MGDIPALEVTVTAPVVSFRNPLYAGVQLTLPCPPPATVGGMLAAAAGGWERVDPHLRFGMSFYARGRGTDLETYHPLEASGRKAEATPREREFLADAVLTIWLLEELAGWERRLRRPVWPLRLGRSQDLVGVGTRRVQLRRAAGHQGSAILPTGEGARGTRMRLPTAVSLDRARTRWDDYWYATAGPVLTQLPSEMASPDGQAVILVPPTHPAHAG